MSRPPLCRSLLFLSIGVAVACPSAAGRRASVDPIAVPVRTHTFDAERKIDVNRINMVVTNAGSFGLDVSAGAPGLYYPKGQPTTMLFAGGLWLGTEEPTRVTVAEYSMEYGAGRILAPGIPENPGSADLVVYKMKRWTGDPADSAHIERTPAELAADPTLDPLVHHSWSEYLAGAATRGAPVRIYRLPLTITPAPGDSVDLPGPDVSGDQMLWSVYNDADPSLHTNGSGSTAPLGIEVHQTTFAFDRPGPLGDVVFVRYRIINRGTSAIGPLYSGAWSDPDIGDFTDDLVGSDVARNMGFAYNAGGFDVAYGTMPPAIGFRVLNAPMYAFTRYTNGTDPQDADESLNLLRGLNPDGSPIIHPIAQVETRFMFPGDPVTGSGWLDDVALDKRMVVSANLFQILPGDSADLEVAIAIGQDESVMASIAKLRCNADFAQQSRASDFHVLDPEPGSFCVAPIVCGRPLPFWQDQCAGGGIDPSQLQGIAQEADAQSAYFTWNSNSAEMCATLQSTGSDLRSQAEREFATLLANVMAARLGIDDVEGDPIVMSPITPVSCPELEETTVADLIRTGHRDSFLTNVTYVNANFDHVRALDGVDFGLPFFGGGAGYGIDFLGSTLDPASDPGPFGNLEVRFTNTPFKAYRYLRHERASDGGIPPAGRRYSYAGFRDVLFQVWDVDRDVPLDAAFVERVVTDDDGTILPAASQPATFDSTWAPDDSEVGGREYLMLLAHDYSGSPDPVFEVDDQLNQGMFPVLYVLAARLRAPDSVIDPGDHMRYDWGLPPVVSVDQRMIELESRPLSEPDVQAAYQSIISCLADLNSRCDKPTSTLASLIHAVARPEAVELSWYAPGLTSARVQRTEPGASWTTLAEVTRDGSGQIAWTDHTVVAGSRYGYRLVDDVGRTQGEAWVDVPSTHRLALAGTRPHPAGSGAIVMLSLPRRAPARLDVLDIAGRRVASREVGALGPGAHSLRMAELDRLPAGVYLLRLVQGREAVTGRMVRIR